MCGQLAISRATLYKYLRSRNVIISAETQRKRRHCGFH
ncbi:hypothetical protein [Legionella sp.]